ncbi:DoxX family protein [Ferrimonas balearica]|uniref:DoxX family protein n=1 Tax=Ferrimonas balearica TaxID=44012 RepID=UPI001C9A249E|nr:DoxX family protein [Ferrimonas balearica]MBY5992227.1 DoxX family protein [Ferrimonas balearica]
MILTVTALLSLFFALAGSIKLTGWQKTVFAAQLEFFHLYGLNRGLMAVVGAIEVFGALAVWFPDRPLGVAGIAALLLTSLGALFCHLRFDSWRNGIPAMITAALSALVLTPALIPYL